MAFLADRFGKYPPSRHGIVPYAGAFQCAPITFRCVVDRMLLGVGRRVYHDGLAPPLAYCPLGLAIVLDLPGLELVRVFAI